MPGARTLLKDLEEIVRITRAIPALREFKVQRDREGHPGLHLASDCGEIFVTVTPTEKHTVCFGFCYQERDLDAWGSRVIHDAMVRKVPGEELPALGSHTHLYCFSRPDQRRVADIVPRFAFQYKLDDISRALKTYLAVSKPVIEECHKYSTALRNLSDSFSAMQKSKRRK